MDECRLTQEQIQRLKNGNEIQVSYSTMEEFRMIATREIKLIPIRVRCDRCEQPVISVNEAGFCGICELTFDGPNIIKRPGRKSHENNSA